MKAVLRHTASLSIVTVAVVMAFGASGSASAATSAAPKARMTTATHATAASKPKKLSTEQQRAKDSSFENQPLDQKAFASTAASSPSATKHSSGSGTLLRALFGLIIVIGAIFGVQWLLKKWAAAKLDGVGSGAAGLIDVVATTGLAQGRTLHLVRVADELVLIGSTEHNIARLGEFDARQLVGDPTDTKSTFALPSATRRALSAGTPTPIDDFHGMLEGSLVSGAPLAAAPAAAAEGSFLNRFLHNLRMQTAR